MPLSSRVRATTTPPYFLARGNTAAMLSSFPLTEFSMALPLYRRRALSMAMGSEVSICSGRSTTAWRRHTVSSSTAGSSISGRPTFTSST